ncbi:MAG: PhnA domain-containing protein [Bacteroidota bacterium]
MPYKQELHKRSGSCCELCSSTNQLTPYEVQPPKALGASGWLLICTTCKNQIENPDKMDPNHWRCLNDSMWSEIPAVQIMAWRMLDRLRGEGWPQELLDMLYLNDEMLNWAQALNRAAEDAVVHLDSNGAVLEAGDSVVLIKDLNVKGANFVAKRGTAIRRISLDADNAEHIEGKINGQHIVVLTKYVKKSK